MKPGKLRLLGLLSLIPLSCVTSCANTTTPVSSFCAIYTPVITTFEDTELTRQQVDENGVVYACICEKIDKFCGDDIK